MKIAVLDLGTNTFHLLVAAVERDRSFNKIFRSKVVVKLGEGAIHRDTLAEIPYARGIHALKHYAGIINQYQPDKIFAFATSAIRNANNGARFIAEARRETGIEIKVITGEEEAELIYHGVKQCVRMTDENQLIMDIGGGSTEFIIADRRKIAWKKSFDIGASRLLAMFRPSDPIAAAEVKELEIFLSERLLPLEKAIKKFPVRTMIGSSGSFDSLAEMIGWRYDGRNILKGVTTLPIDLDRYQNLHRDLLQSTMARRMKMKGLVKMRLDTIVLASICINFILKKFNFSEMVLSKYALKEGAMWKVIQQLPDGDG